MKMNINEACQLARKLELCRTELMSLLLKNEYSATIIEKHLKSKALSDALDETVEDKEEKRYDISADEIIEMSQKLVDSKANLSELISTCRNNLTVLVDGREMKLDAVIEYNKNIRELISYISRVVKKKDSVSKEYAMDYTFDVEHKQTTYRYPVEVETKVNFNREEMKQTLKDLKSKADKISVSIEKAKILSEVDFDSVLADIDNLEDVILALKE